MGCFYLLLLFLYWPFINQSIIIPAHTQKDTMEFNKRAFKWKKKYSKIYEPKINLIISTFMLLCNTFITSIMRLWKISKLNLFEYLASSCKSIKSNSCYSQCLIWFDFRRLHIKYFVYAERLKLLLLSMVKNSFTKEVFISRI